MTSGQQGSSAHREIERKFLVYTERLPDAARHGGGARMEQGYLSYEPSVRVRLAEDEAGGNARAWLTIKGPGTVERAEFEYAIPPEDARALLGLCRASLRKVRRRVTVGRHIWEVDEFLGSHLGLWLAEVELGAADEAFDRPEWLGDEVSHDPRYTNGALARAGHAP